MPHLYTSVEFQTFIKSSASFEIVKLDFQEKKYSEIANNFLAAFPEHVFFKISHGNEEDIKGSFDYFSYALASFEKFEALCKYNVESFYTYEQGMIELMDTIKDINEFYTEYYDSKGFVIEKKEFFTNPYLILLDWCRAEILDLNAIIEAIKKREKFAKTRKKIFQKYKHLQSEYFSYKPIFTESSKVLHNHSNNFLRNVSRKK